MKIVYASRTGNVESIVNALNMDAMMISDGSESVVEPYILFTYTDGWGDVPYEVESFLANKENATNLKGVVVSGDTSYGEAYCLAGDKISEEYHVPCLYKVENEGNEDDINEIKKLVLNA